jgi:methylthioribulose-1-phosphate dehydratase
MNNDPRLNLIAAARQFYQLGWMVGTAGNISARMPDDTIWITASGKSKGKLTEQDFVRINLEGEILESPHPNNRPSAETSIHQAIYSLFPQAKACYHVHSVEANLVSRFARGNQLPLPGIEMIKGLGVWTENPRVSMPVFENYQEVPLIAAEITSRFQINPPDVPACLILHHGVTVWAPSPETAENYIETAEYIFRYIITAHQAGLDYQI